MPQEENMRVVVRMRPSDDGDGVNKPTVDTAGHKISVLRDRKGSAEFSFSNVLGIDSTQENLYDICKDTVNDVMDGINCCILAYGQTGSGKTHSMLGKGWEDPNFVVVDDSDPLSPGQYNCDEYGIVPRSVADIFTSIDALRGRNEDSFNFLINCQFLQIYNEKIYDLLQDRKRENPLQLRDAERGAGSSVYVQGLSEYQVRSADDVLGLMAKGLRNRAIRSTELNNESSRSHTILQLFVQLQGVDGSGLATLKRSVFSFVDLAGSEKWRPSLSHSQIASGGLVTAQHTAAEQQLREMTNINTSLHVLGNCVSALIEPGRRHIPFRDSLLTRLLQDSLGGGRTILIATVRSDEGMIDETYSTLQFASRASKIKTVLRPSSKLLLGSEIGSDGLTVEKARKEIALLRSQVQSLQLELEASRALSTAAQRRSPAEGDGGCQTCVHLRAAVSVCQKHIRELQAMVQSDIEREEGLWHDDDERGEGELSCGGDDSGASLSCDDEQPAVDGGELSIAVPRASPIAHHKGSHSPNEAVASRKKKPVREGNQLRTKAAGSSRAPLPKRKALKKNRQEIQLQPPQRSSLKVGTKQTVGMGVSDKTKLKSQRALSAGQGLPASPEKGTLPSLKSNSAGSSPVIKQNRTVVIAVEKGRVSDKDTRLAEGRIHSISGGRDHHIRDTISMSRVASTHNSQSPREPLPSPVLPTPTRGCEDSMKTRVDRQWQPLQPQPQQERNTLPSEGSPTPLVMNHDSSSAVSTHDEGRFLMTQKYGSNSIRSSRESHLTSPPPGIAGRPPLVGCMASPASPASVHSMSSLRTTATDAPGGACKKHGLQACVLCAMFGAPTGTSQSTQPLKKHSLGNTAGSTSTYCVDSGFAESTSQAIPSGGFTPGTGFCPVHHVLDCLLCSMEPNGAISVSSTVKKTNPSDHGQTMYAAAMLGEGSFASSVSSLSSIDSAFGFNSMKAALPQQQTMQSKGRNGSSDFDYEQGFWSKRYSDATSPRRSHNVVNQQATESGKSTEPLQDSCVPRLDRQVVNRYAAHSPVSSLRSGNGEDSSCTGPKPLKYGGGIVYEDEADMIGKEQPSLISAQSHGRRDHRRVPFNRDRYSDITDTADNGPQRHEYCSTTGHTRAGKLIPSEMSHVDEGTSINDSKVQRRRDVVQPKKKTRRLPNGAVVAMKS